MRSFSRPSDGAGSLVLATVAALLAGTALSIPRRLAAQIPDSVYSVGGVSRRYEVSVISGYQQFATSAALDGSPILGARIARTIVPRISAGAGFAFARPMSRGEYFPWNRQPYFENTRQNDTTLIYSVSQRTTLMTGGIDVNLRLPVYALNPRSAFAGVALEGGVGVGFYNFWLDPQQSRGQRRFGGLAYQFGGGVSIPASRGSAIRLRVDDVLFTHYDRDRLSLSDPLFSEDLFRNPDPAPPAKQRSVHNIRIALWYSFVPGASEQ
ncbi:MAG: hypothetical protein WKG32_08475 [Gemmatimonadaceae bacterium]